MRIIILLFLSLFNLALSYADQSEKTTKIVTYINPYIFSTNGQSFPDSLGISDYLKTNLNDYIKNHLIGKSSFELQDTNIKNKQISRPEILVQYMHSTDTTEFYLILVNIKSFNELIYLQTAVYFIYGTNPLKYFELFGTRTKYHNPNFPQIPNLKERLFSELVSQLKSGFDNKINVLFENFKMDVSDSSYNFLRHAVPEYLKARLSISGNIKVYHDSLKTGVPGVTKKPHYSVKGFVFDDRDRIHIISHCTDENEDQIILSKQISFAVSDPDSLSIKLNEIGDNFRNAILMLYDNKTKQRRKSIAIVPKPPFFFSEVDRNDETMKQITLNIVQSIIASFNEDTTFTYDIVIDPLYSKKIIKYVNHPYENSVICNELNADNLLTVQLIGNLKRFNLELEIYQGTDINSKKVTQILKNINLRILKNRIDKSIQSLICKWMPDTKDTCIHKPSAYIDVIYRRVGLRLKAMNAGIFSHTKSLFLGNKLRHTVELGAYYTFPVSLWFFEFPVAIDFSFQYDFGKQEKEEGLVYGRNIHVQFKSYLPTYGKISKQIRYYLGLGFSFIDVHRVSGASSGGSFEPGFTSSLGFEYSFNEDCYFDFSCQYINAGHIPSASAGLAHLGEGYYQVLFLGIGLGYEF